MKELNKDTAERFDKLVPQVKTPEEEFGILNSATGAKLTYSSATEAVVMNQDYQYRYHKREKLKEFIASEIELAEKRGEEAKNQAYWERNQLVLALSKIYPSWLGYHKDKDWEDDWRNIVYIKVPTLELEQKYTQGGFEVNYKRQLSWHIHDNDLKYFSHLDPGLEEWDGHSTEEKYRRLANLKTH